MSQNTLHAQTAKFIASVSTCLPELDSLVMQRLIGKPKILQSLLAELACPFDIWRKVRLGSENYKGFVKEVRAQETLLGRFCAQTGLPQSQKYLSDEETQILCKKAIKQEIQSCYDMIDSAAFEIFRGEFLVELVRVKSSDFGFRKDEQVTLKSFYERAKLFNLCPCPPETGVLLHLIDGRMTYDSYSVAMNPICAGNASYVFYHTCNDGSYIEPKLANKDVVVDSDAEWVFVRKDNRVRLMLREFEFKPF